MTTRDLTPEEWIDVRKARAHKLAGYPCHEHRNGDARSFYVWSWGNQPQGQQLKRLQAGCPIRAAEKFLAIFERGPTHAQPVFRAQNTTVSHPSN